MSREDVARGATAAPTRWAGAGRLIEGRVLLAVLGVYTLMRVFTTGVLWWIAQTQQDPVVFTGERPRYFDLATLWDGQWYQRIATEGYPSELPRNDSGQVRQNPWAFYPIFPLMARGVMALTGLSFPVAATLVATVLGYAAAVALAVLLLPRIGARFTVAAVALFAAFPAAPTLQIAYTESLAVLLLCLVLWYLGRGRWGSAAVVALVTGLARPVALPLGLVALVAVWLRWRRREQQPLAPGESLRMLAALAACGVSGMLWPAIVWWGTGERDGYTLTMSSWRGGEDIVPFQPAFRNSQWLFGDTLGPVLVVAVFTLLAIAVLGPWARALGPELRTWSLAYPFYLLATTNPWTSTYRYLLPMLGVYVLLVGGGWRSDDLRRRGRPEDPDWLFWLRTGVLVALFLAWQVWWSWELLRFVPPSDDPP